MTGHYPSEGPVAGFACPKCNASEVECITAMYEFSELLCQKCGFKELVDAWQIEDWFAP